MTADRPSADIIADLRHFNGPDETGYQDGNGRAAFEAADRLAELEALLASRTAERETYRNAHISVENEMHRLMSAGRASRELLTEAELRAMDITVDLVNVMCKEVISRGPQRESDVREFVHHVHIIQASILAQAAGRAYPDRFRPLGGRGE